MINNKIIVSENNGFGVGSDVKGRYLKLLIESVLGVDHVLVGCILWRLNNYVTGLFPPLLSYLQIWGEGKWGIKCVEERRRNCGPQPHTHYMLLLKKKNKN